MTQLNSPAPSAGPAGRLHLKLVVYQPPEQDAGPAAPPIGVPYEIRDHLARKVAVALDVLALAEADGVAAVCAAAAEDAAYPLNQLIDLFAARYQTSAGRARSHAMRMVRERMGVVQDRCWEKVSARERREQITSLVREGLSVEAIAQRLKVTVRTVLRHKHAAGLTSRTYLYDEWAPRILGHLRVFPETEFSGGDLARLLLGEPSNRFVPTLRRLEREGQVISVACIRDSSSPTVRVTRWRLAPEEGGGSGDAEV
ncbi:helix-turn-helix domain-containing protein [Nonomuraea wenchangensis]|uniref:Homeodomain-like domain-containing protein n=1 Tax=Nonomuraea wenchangensis TaxID=568860 RepID=A0A1I0LVV3_9ACTN|nr:hypothetical protein [Nonomuraea wenchangensis]SEU46865.1 hypothetical protein SAMN05421811_127165 [Nonomuraea wenchangensis]